MEGRAAAAQDARVLAEAVSFTEEQMLVILLVILGVLALHVVAAALGCVWAWRAGGGSQLALVGWLVLLGFEVLYVSMAVPGLLGGEPNLLLCSAAVPVAAQLFLFVRARDRGAHPLVSETRGQPGDTGPG